MQVIELHVGIDIRPGDGISSGNHKLAIAEWFLLVFEGDFGEKSDRWREREVGRITRNERRFGTSLFQFLLRTFRFSRALLRGG